MSDISMCNGYNCPISTTCYRFTAKPDKYGQAYADFSYVDGNCDYYWKNKEV